MNQNRPRDAESVSYIVQILGELRIERVQGEERRLLPIPAGNARSLLAYLLIHAPARHPRERLGELFWPGTPPNRMRRALSDLLYRLRQSLCEEWFAGDTHLLALRSDLPLQVDLWTFQQAIKSGAIPDLERAIELYRGDLLPELYDDWVLVPRVALQESYLTALQILGKDAEERRILGRALVYYQQLTQADPLREEGYRGVMRVLAGQGQWRRALSVYEVLATNLEREVDVPPSEATQRLAAQLRSEQSVYEAGQAAHLSVPERMPLVGRHPERRTLLRSLETLHTGRGGLAAVEGEAGLGKTRLLQTILESARWRGIPVAMGHASAYPAASPLTPLQQMVEDALRPPRVAQVTAQLSADQLAALAELYPPWSDRTALIELSGERALQRFHDAVRALFSALGQVSPHLFVLDDAHWAEPALWDLLDAIVPLLPSARILVLVAYRRSICEKTGAWERLSRWEGEGHLQVVSLSPLSASEVAHLLPPHWRSGAAQVHAATGGNPFYVRELLLNPGNETRDPHLTVAERVRTLPPAAWRALETAAVLGDEFAYVAWKALLDETDEELERIGRTLVEQVLLQPTQRGYEFVHALIQSAIYERILPERRRELHAQAAELFSPADESTLRRRAFHLEQAGAAAESAQLYRLIGRHQAEHFAFAEAQSAFERALELLAGDAHRLRTEILLQLAASCEVTGDRTRQKNALDEALALAAALEDERMIMQVLVQLGNWAARTGDHAGALDWLGQALDLVHQLEDEDQDLEIELIMGDLLWRSGDPKQARVHLERALSLARRLGKQPQEGRALEGIAWTIGQSEGNTEKVFALYAQALAVQRACGDRLGEARTLLNLLSVYQNVGAWDRMLTMAQDALAAQEQVSYRLGEAVAHQSLGLASYALGDYDQAQQQVSTARSCFDAVGERLGVVITTGTLGLIAARRGDLSEAERLLRAALASTSALDSTIFQAFTQQDLGSFLVEQGHLVEGIELLRAAIANWHNSGEQLNPLKCEAHLGLALLAQGERAAAEELAQTGWEAFQQESTGGEELQAWLWTLSRLFSQLNHTGKAHHLLRAAYAELQRQAGVIADVEVRRRFFADVPLNAAIVAAHDRLTGTVRRHTVTLARRDAPLGRALTPEEQVTVHWTVLAPEDEVIDERAQRRRRTLVRLVQEAAAQHAVPTDQNLAHVLGVSRRTILRDIDALAQAGVNLPTRARR